MVPCFDFRACLSTMLVVSENRRLCQSGSGRQGTGLRIGKEIVSEKEDSQVSIWGLGTECGAGWLSKMEGVLCVAFYWGPVRVTPRG
jgi:hypothetical protein